MEQREYLNNIHSEILKIMDIIDDLCEKNNIKYYMTGGTLLGAIRHNGFIPWDDDFDIAMPREDFDKFINLCKTKLPEGYSLLWISTKKDYWRLFAKISNDRTQFIESIGENEKTDSGIFVDIFPLDESVCYNHKLQKRKDIIEKIKVLITAKKAPSVLGGWKRFASIILPNRLLFKLALIIMTLNNGKGYKYYSNFGSQYTIQKRTIEKEKIGDGIKVKFEDRMYYAPNCYIEVLEHIFGKNYMELPPVEKRKTHYPVFVKFSNGDEIAFEQQVNRLSINDTY